MLSRYGMPFNHEARLASYLEYGVRGSTHASAVSKPPSERPDYMAEYRVVAVLPGPRRNHWASTDGSRGYRHRKPPIHRSRLNPSFDQYVQR